MLKRARRLLRSRSAHHKVAKPLQPGVLSVSATGNRNPRAQGNEVVIIEIRTASGLPVDLAKLAGTNMELMREVVVGRAQPVPVGLKLLPGAKLELRLGQGGWMHLLCHPWSGAVRIESTSEAVEIDLFSPKHELRRVDAAELLPLLPDPTTEILTVDTAALDHVREEAHRQLQALRPLQSRGDVLDSTLAIYTPRWKGVSAATRNLFRCLLPVPLSPHEHPDAIGSAYVDAIAECVADSNFSTVVFSGGDAALLSLARRLKELRPRLSIRVLWHGSYLQMGETHEWKIFNPWLVAAQSGLVDCVGLVKPGMDVFLRSLGVHAVYVQNSVPYDRSQLTPPEVSDVVGMWLSGSSEYRKMPYATLLALAGSQQLALRASGLGELGFRMLDELGVRTEARFFEPIPHGQVLQEIARTRLTLYVTLSECMPMLPLESIACGVPCIVGPATKFYDTPYLADRLMVEDPSNPASIRRHINVVLDEYDEIATQSFDFLDRMAALSTESLNRFLT